MRYLRPLVVLVFMASASRAESGSTIAPANAAPAPVNAVIGDASFVAAFGRLPDRNDDDTLRIRTHLAFIERYLRAQEPAAMRPDQRTRRHAALDALVHYAAGGVFPRRTVDGYGERRPRFIDDLGTHCAVGQLIADSGERALAREIADRFEYAYIPDIDTPALRAWANRTGFSIRELAMIQPSYPSRPTVSETHNFVQAAMETAALECARTIPMPFKITLKVTGLRHAFDYYPELAAPRDEFGICVVKAVSAWPVSAGNVLLAGDNPKLAFPFAVTASLGTAQDTFQRWFDTLAAGGIFHRTDDALWKLAASDLKTVITIDATSDKSGTTVSITSTPSNSAIEQSFKATFEDSLKAFGAGPWNANIHDKRTVAEWRNLRALGFSVEDTAVNADMPCWQPASGESSPMVTAKVDASGALSVSTDARDPALRRCITTLVTERLAAVTFDAGGAVTHRRRFPIDSPPLVSAVDTRNHVTAYIEEAASICARTHTMPASITLKTTGVRRVLGYRAVFATTRDPFVRCVASELSAADIPSCRLAANCPKYPNIKFPQSITVPLGTAQALYQRRFETLTSDLRVEQGHVSGSKEPSPHEKLLASDGTRLVTIDVAPGPRVATFSIKTTPHDSAVQTLLEEAFKPLLEKLDAGAPGVKIHDERSVDSWLNVMSLHAATFLLDFRCPQAASDEIRTVMTLTLAADATVSVTTDITDPDLRTCITDRVTKSLKNAKLRRNAPATFTTTTYVRPPGYRDDRPHFNDD